jgi:hypothetical protein
MKSLAQVLGFVHQPVHQPQRRLTLAVVAPRVCALGNRLVLIRESGHREDVREAQRRSAARSEGECDRGDDEHRLDVHGGHRHLRLTEQYGPWVEPGCSSPYSPKCLEDELCELRLDRVLKSSREEGCKKLRRMASCIAAERVSPFGPKREKGERKRHALLTCSPQGRGLREVETGIR